MRQRLKAAGMRPISNVVDVTNYVMLELGQPLHAFDLDRVRGQTIVVRRAFEGERLVTLDGVDRRLTTEDLVVADGEVASGLAGTMGGEESEVSSSTTRILIEAAAWDPPTVGFMSRRHSLRSEASARFERGVDPNLPPQAAARAARLMLELGGGEALEGWIDAIAVEKPMWQITLTMSDVARILGDGFDSEMVAGLLRRLHLGVEGSDPLEVTVPTFRGDLTRPIDLVEEVARLWGYDNFSETVPTGGSGGWSAAQTRRRHLRSALSGAGLSEALTLSFLGKGDLEVMAYPLDHEGRLTIRVKNPLNDEMESLRTSLIPGLLRSLAYNHSHGLTDVGLYEIGRVFFARPWPEDRRVPDQPEKLGFAVGGRFGPVVFDSPTPFADSYTATALWRLIAEKLDLGGYELTPVAVPGFHPGRCAGVSIDGRPIGHVGEIHPATVAAYGLFGRVAAGELDLGLMLDPVPRRQLSEPSLYPPVDFDLAFEVSEETPASKVLAATAAAGSDLVESAHVFDEFKGGSLHDGRKSLAIRYRLRASDRTLTNQDAAAVRSAMIVAAASIGAVLRGS
jgi:phenylalanyl-tRNA synthetase beta chain